MNIQKAKVYTDMTLTLLPMLVGTILKILETVQETRQAMKQNESKDTKDK